MAAYLGTYSSELAERRGKDLLLKDVCFATIRDLFNGDNGLEENNVIDVGISAASALLCVLCYILRLARWIKLSPGS